MFMGTELDNVLVGGRIAYSSPRHRVYERKQRVGGNMRLLFGEKHKKSWIGPSIGDLSTKGFH